MTLFQWSSWASPAPRRQGRRSVVLAAYVLFTLTSILGACSSQSPPSAQASSSGVQPPAATQPRVSNPEPSGGKPEKQAAASRRDKDTRTGLASFIAAGLQGRKTASGELYDGAKLVAAHPSYPMGTVVQVTNRNNGRVVQVKVIDRSAAGRNRPIIDLSRTAAERLDFVRQGTVQVTTEVTEWGTALAGK